MYPDETEELQPEEKRIAIYSRWAILGFSIFFSPLIGSVLMVLNLRSIGNKRVGYLVLSFGIVYIIVAGIAVITLLGIPLANITPEKLLANPKTLYYSKAMDILGAGILTEYFFKKYFTADDYDTKSIWPPLLIILLFRLLTGLL